MPSTKETPAATPPGGSHRHEKPRRRRLKWARRLGYSCVWLVLVAGCLAVLTHLLVRVFQENATPLVNQVREYFAPDHQVQIGSVSFPADDLVEFNDVTFELPQGGGRAASIERVQMRIDRKTFFTDPRVLAMRIENPQVTLNGALLELFAPDPEAGGKPLDLGWIKIDDLRIVNGQVDVDLAGVPRGSLHLDLEAAEIDLSREGELVSTQPQHLILRDLRVEDPSGASDTPLATVEELAATLRLNKDLISGAFATVKLKEPVVRCTPEFVAALMPAAAGEPEVAPAGPAAGTGTGPAPMRWSIDAIEFDDGFFTMSGFYDTPDVSFRHSGTLTDFHWSSVDGLSWPTRQEATVTDLRIDSRPVPVAAASPSTAPGETLATSDQIELAVIPDEFFAHGRIEEITSSTTRIHISKERLDRFFADAPDDPALLLIRPGAGGETAEDEDSSNPVPPWFVRAHKLDITGVEVVIEGDGFLSGLPRATCKLDLHSVGKRPAAEGSPTGDGVADDVGYHLSMTDLKVYDETSALTPIVAGEEIFAEFTAAGVQLNHRVDSVSIEGFDIRIGDEISRLIAENSPEAEDGGEVADVAEEDQPPAPETAADGDEQEHEWVLGSLELDRTRVTLEDFIPGLPYLPMWIDTSMEEIPLSGRTRGDERIQKALISNVEIAAPFNPLLPVARLQSIYLRFSIPGLIRNEIEEVVIVSPELFLGEPMFWYINEFQKVAASEPVPDPAGEEAKIATHASGQASDPCDGGEDSVAAGDDTEGKIEALEGLADTRISGWQIKKISAKEGSLVVAPKGYPIGIIPFPFSGETDLTKGKVRLDLKIPRDDYVFGAIDLEFVGLYGDAYFNYPPEEDKKNFVQVFYVPTVHYGDYRIDDFHLSVTFNGERIFARFGGWAYAGYVNGEIDVEIGQTYTWAGWVAGTNLMLSPLTAALSPETVNLTGSASARIIANGEGIIPSKITAKLDTQGPCHMHINSLDEAVEAVEESPQAAAPTIWEAFIDPINRALSKASLEVFQNYNFTTGTANLNLVGRDGDASILLDGPEGRRQIDVKFIDRTTTATTSTEKVTE